MFPFDQSPRLAGTSLLFAAWHHARECFHSIKVPDQQGLSFRLLIYGFTFIVSIRSKSPTSRDNVKTFNYAQIKDVSIRSKSPTSRDSSSCCISKLSALSFHSIKVPDQQGHKGEVIGSFTPNMVSIRSKSPTSRDIKKVGSVSTPTTVSIRSKSPTSRDCALDSKLLCSHLLEFPFDQSPRLAGTRLCLQCGWHCRQFPFDQSPRLAGTRRC